MRKGIVHSQIDHYFLVAERRWLTEKRADMRLVSKWGPRPKKPSGHRSKLGFSVAFSKALQASFQPESCQRKRAHWGNLLGMPIYQSVQGSNEKIYSQWHGEKCTGAKDSRWMGEGREGDGQPLTVHLSSKRVHPEPKGQEDRRWSHVGRQRELSGTANECLLLSHYPVPSTQHTKIQLASPRQ